MVRHALEDAHGELVAAAAPAAVVEELVGLEQQLQVPQVTVAQGVVGSKPAAVRRVERDLEIDADVGILYVLQAGEPR